MKPRFPAFIPFALLLMIGAFLASCGGGSGGGAPGAGGIPVFTPTPCPAGYTGTAPACTQVQSANSFSAIPTATTAPLPAIGGYSGIIAIPAAAQPGPVKITTSLMNPGVPVLTFRARESRVRFAQVDTPLLYITFTASSGGVTFTGGFPGFAITLPSGAGNGPFYLAELENGTTWTTIAGPATPSGGVVTLQPNLQALAIPAGGSVYFLLYTGGVVPAAVPTSSPGGQPTSSASPGATPTSANGPSASPSGRPTTSPTTFPSTSPTPIPTVAPNGSPPASFNMGVLPNGAAGTAFTNTPVSGFQVLDPASNPITGSFSKAVTITSSNPAVTLSVLGGASGASVQLTAGSEIVAMSYSGAAVTPVTIAASASGATSNSTLFSPPIPPIVYSGPLNTSSAPEIDLYAPSGAGTGSSFQFTVSQAGYTGTYGHSLTLSGQSGCSTFASMSPSSGTSFTVASIAAPVAGSCTITVNGFNGTTLNVIVTYSTLGVVLQ